MSEIDKAIASLELGIKTYQNMLSGFNRPLDDAVKIINDEIQSYKLAIQALEKQIPKALTHEATIYACGTCPNCKNVVRERNQTFDYRYCHFCGQRLGGIEETIS